MNAATAATASLASTSGSNSGWIPTIVEAKATLPWAASSAKFADNSDGAVDHRSYEVVLELLTDASSRRTRPAVIVVQEHVRDVIPVVRQPATVCGVRLRQQVGRERGNAEGYSLDHSVDGRRDRPHLPVAGGGSGTTQVHCPVL